MKHIISRTLQALTLAVGLAVAGTVSLGAITQLNQTTTTAAVTVTASKVALTSVSNIVVGDRVFVDLEDMVVLAVDTTGLTVTVRRGTTGTKPGAHANGATVFTGTPDRFKTADPPLATCTGTEFPYQPWINTSNGNIWLCRSLKWKATNVTPITYDSLTATP